MKPWSEIERSTEMKRNADSLPYWMRSWKTEKDSKIFFTSGGK